MSKAYNVAYHAAYYLENKERIKAMVNANRKPPDPDKKKANSARYYAKHRERIRARVNADRALKRVAL